MRFRQAGTELECDGACVLLGKRSASEPGSQRFAVEKLHGEKINLALVGGSRMDLKKLAHIGMADFGGIAHLRRQSLAETGFRALKSNAPFQLFVHRFVNDAHTTLSHFAYNP